MIKSPHLYLHHILESIENITSYTSGLSEEEFYQKNMNYDAVLRNLQTLAESVKYLPEEITSRHPLIPWKDIIGFRNILVHDYLDGIDQDIIWRIIHHELDPVRKVMLQELQKN